MPTLSEGIWDAQFLLAVYFGTIGSLHMTVEVSKVDIGLQGGPGWTLVSSGPTSQPIGSLAKVNFSFKASNLSFSSEPLTHTWKEANCSSGATKKKGMFKN